MTTVAVNNYLVPATGTTNALQISRVFSATPFFVDFNSEGLDGLPFRPSGVIIDNSQGTGPLTVLINEIGYRISCPIGATVQMQYPAPVGHTANITGLGQATVVFVDYPVIPFDLTAPGTNPISIADGADVALGATGDAMAVDPNASNTVVALLKRIARAELPSAATIVSLTTNAVGATFNAFAAQPCVALDIVNTSATAVSLEVRRGATGNTIIVPPNSSRVFTGITDASQLQVRREDQSNTQVTFTAEAL